jgi:hypothetical protein
MSYQNAPVSTGSDSDRIRTQPEIVGRRRFDSMTASLTRLSGAR